MKKVFKTMAFTLLGLVLSVNLMAGVSSWTHNGTAEDKPTEIDDFSVAYGKGNGSTAPTGYDESIRLYCAKNGTGNTLTFSTSEEGVYITKVELAGSVNQGTLSFTWNGTTSKVNNAKDAWYVEYAEATKVQSVTCTLKNTNTSKTGQFRLTGIKITYVGGSTKTLTSIAITGTATHLNYTEGETFDKAGLTITGTYSDASQKELTSGITWSYEPETLTTSTTSVEVTASVEGVDDATTTISGITVSKAPVEIKDYKQIIDGCTYYIKCGDNYLSFTDAKNATQKGTADTKDNAVALTFTSVGENIYNITTPNGLFIAPGTSNGTINVSETAIDVTASLPSGKSNVIALSIVSGSDTWFIQKNNSGTQFGGYKGTQTYITLLQISDCTPKTLESIEVKTTEPALKTDYYVGYKFDPTNLVITAKYEEAEVEDEDISYAGNEKKFTFSPDLETALAASNTEVTITYGGKSVNQAITVNRKAAEITAATAKSVNLSQETIDDLIDFCDVSFTEGYDGEISFTSSDEETLEIYEGGALLYKGGTVKVTISGNQTDTYAKPEDKEVEITINAVAVTYTVSWKNQGNEYTVGEPTTKVDAGSKVTVLPTAPIACDDQHEFMGWTATETITDGKAPSDLFKTADDAPTVDGDVTYNAVYAVKSQGEAKKGFALSNAAPVAEENVLIAGEKAGTYYAFDKDMGSVQLSLDKDNLVSNENISSLVWATSTQTVSQTTGIGFKNSDGKTLHINSSALKLATDWTNGTFEFAADATNGGFQMKSNQNARWFKFNNAYEATNFTYSTSAVGGIYFFKEKEIPGAISYTGYSTSCEAIELDHIELSGAVVEGKYTTEFLQGDEFTHEGVVVTAKYTNGGADKIVTDEATFSTPTMTTTGEQTITVSYGGKEATYTIKVNEWPNKTIQEFITAEGTKCYLTAFVSNLDGNQYDLTDNSGTIHGYKYTLADGVSALANGDRIRVKAEEYEYFQGKTHEVKNIVVVEKLAYTSIEVSGAPSKLSYTAGQSLDPTGLTVKGKYSDNVTQEIPAAKVTWNTADLVLEENQETVDVIATVQVNGSSMSSEKYTVTDLTVLPATRTLESISLDVTEAKISYWVGENFSTDGVKVYAKFADSETPELVSGATFSKEEVQITDKIVSETITVTYTNGGTKTDTYTINAKWMTLADLVAKGKPSTIAVSVWVEITDAMIKATNSSYITTDVTYGENKTQEVKIYKSGVPSDWKQYGTISGQLKGVDWKLFNNTDWELMPSDWTWAKYTAPAETHVTDVSIEPSSISIKAGKSVTLTAKVLPDNATDKSVTWSIEGDSKISIDQTGKVTVVAGATEGATATVTVTTTDGGKTATCDVTVIASVAADFGLYYGALTEGDYIISYSGYLLKNTITSNRFDNVTDIAAVNNIISTDNEAIIWHIAKSGDNWTICSAENGKYAGSTGSKNQGKMLDDATTDNALWAVVSDENSETYDFENIARKNASSDQNNKWLRNNEALGWACYTTQTGGALTLYKAGFTPAPALSSLEITGELSQTEYFLGKSVKYDGLSVLGHYSDGSEAAITDGITWSADPTTFTELGEKVVKITATVQTKTGEVPGNKEFNVTVVESHQINYGLVTSVNTLYDGAVVVLGAVYEKDDEPIYAVNQGFYTSNYKYLLAYRSNIENSDLEYENEVMKTANASEITLKKVENGWLLIDEDNNYICGAADLSKTTNVEDATVWTISIAEGNAVIAAGNYQFCYNKNSGTERFKTYASTSPQAPIGIYMKNLVAIRTGLTAGKIGTICYPQAIAAVDGANLYQPNYKDDAVKNIYFSTPDEYSAGLPMIFQADREIMKVLFTGNVVEDPIDNMEITRGMVGSFEHVDIENNGKNFIFSNNKLYLAGENCWIDSNRAYIDLSQVPFSDGQLSHDLPGGAPRKTISLGNASASTPTNLNGLNGNIKAQKVMKDGQFYIIREAKMYNAQGIKVQ